MGDAVKLTPRAAAALEAASRVPVIGGTPVAKTAHQLGSTPAVCGNLFRRGLLRGERQSEHLRGEPRVYWMIYRITPAGLSALTSKEQNNG